MQASHAIAIVLSLFVFPLWAGDETPGPAQETGRTDNAPANTGRTGEAPPPVEVRPAPPARDAAADLQAVVVLCATQPESAEFRERWADWVEQNFRDADQLQRTIENVLNRASAYRQRQHSATGELTWTAAERQRARQVMRDTALEVIRRLGG